MPAPAETRPELSPEVLAAVRRIQLRARRSVNDLLAGHYLSTFRGVGMEFEEVRVYTPGDDVRSIDWNVTARTGVPHVKRFVEEREQTVLLLVDVSASGAFGTVRRTKNEAAAELCALLSLAAVENHDKVGLVLFSDDVELFLPPKRGRRHVLRLIREVLLHRPRLGRTRLDSALRFLDGVTRRRATVFVVSDFLLDGPQWEGVETALRVARRRHDAVAVALHDPREEELPPAGLVELVDLETGARRLVDTSSRRVRDAYARSGAERRAARAARFERLRVDEVAIDVAGDWVEPLVEFFRRRERRARREGGG